ncbi:tetratricopeptide repeat protein [Succinatimonas hippei]|uniref:tetratricopeptide repeat protein n=1 Tax=Succinatimonas hippei TaxID=626938 RepID=UPI0026EDB5E7|nr:tetratricopeptide repeat protein [Succinatimonas hippei]
MVKSLKILKAGTERLVLAFFLCAGLCSCSLLSPRETQGEALSFLGAFSVPKEDIVIVEPSKENRDRDQLIVIQLSQMLESSQVKSPSARAEVFYDLGIIYDRLGLEASARSMFLNSLSERPDFAPSYNIIGVYLAQNENFQDAYEAFDSALELDPDNLYPLMNRAIALYYAGRYSLARSLSYAVALSYRKQDSFPRGSSCSFKRPLSKGDSRS